MPQNSARSDLRCAALLTSFIIHYAAGYCILEHFGLLAQMNTLMNRYSSAQDDVGDILSRMLTATVLL